MVVSNDYLIVAVRDLSAVVRSASLRSLIF